MHVQLPSQRRWLSLLVALSVVALAGVLLSRSADAQLTGGPAIIPAPDSVIDDPPGATNDNQQAFDEAQGVTLPAPVNVDGGTIAAGTVVDSHMIFLNTVGGASASDTQTWTFEGPIIGVMSDSDGALEVASTSVLGAPGTAYPAVAFGARGLEGNDSYTVAGNSITVEMHVTEPGDWIRVVTCAEPLVTPSMVDRDVLPGESIHVQKCVATPAIPPLIDIVLLQDMSGSFNDDVPNVQGAAPGLIAALDGSGSNYATAVTTFIDFAADGWGSDFDDGVNDHVYRRIQDVTPGGAGLSNGLAALPPTGFGGDGPEGQLEALHYLATPAHAAIDANQDGDTTDGIDTPVGQQPTWRAGAARVVLLATDAGCHVPGDAGGWPGDSGLAATIAALNAANITVIGLTPSGPGIGCVDNVAGGTGGSVHAIGADSATIADAILAGLGNLPITVTPVAQGCDPLTVEFSPASRTVTSGDPALFEEWITAPEDFWGEVHCTVEFTDESGAVIAVQEIWIDVLDVVPPEPTGSLDPVCGVEEPTSEGDFFGFSFSLTSRFDGGGCNFDEDEQLFEVHAACEDDCDPNPTFSSEINGIDVEDGETVLLRRRQLETGDDFPTRTYVRYDGVRVIEASHFELVVECTDASGNVGLVVVEPEFPADDDEEDDLFFGF